MRSIRCLPTYFIFVTLLVALASPSAAGTFSLTGTSYDETLSLKLIDGRQLEGRYRGLLGSPGGSSNYAGRYETWRNTLGPAAAPALGETLVVDRAYGQSTRGVFRGFGERALLLGTADSCVHVLVTLDPSAAVRRAADESPDPVWFVARDCWANAPQVYAVAFESGGAMLAVPATYLVSNPVRDGATIAATAPISNSASSSGGAVAGGILIGLILGGLLAYAAIGAAYASAFSHALW